MNTPNEKKPTIPSPTPSTVQLSSDGKPMSERDQRLLSRMLTNLNNASRRAKENKEESEKAEQGTSS